MIEWFVDNFPPLNLFNYPSFFMTKTQDIFTLTAPYNNPYQGPSKRLLFVCSAGLLRSPTGANLYAKKGYNTRSCGSTEYALIPLSANLIAWADKIIFVNEENYKQADEHHFMDKNKVMVLDIPDNYEYNHPELIEHFERQLEGYL